MAYETLLYEKRNGIGYVTISRPEKLNALNRKVMAELSDCFERVQAAASISDRALSATRR